MSISILGAVLSILFAALIAGVVFHYLRFPIIVGYLFVGAMVGPHALGLIPDEASIKILAEFGIVFLMFMIGLEFSLSKLKTLRYWVFGVGGLQVIIGIAFTTMMGIFIGMTPLSAFVVGGIVTMSSTAIVMKELFMQGEIYSKIGNNAVGILLAQDLAVIPFVILLACFSADTGQPVIDIIIASIKIILAFTVIFFSGRWLLKPLFRIVSATRTLELFTFLVLLVALGTAWLTHSLGLSYALGAFLSGVMLSETEFKHQIEVEIRPFRDVLLGLFFISIGMLLDVSTWQNTWVWILLLITALIVFKTVLITVLCRLAGDDYLSSFRTGLILAQGGEFGFAIFTFAISKNLLPPEYGQVVLAALWISIAVSPLLIRGNKSIANFLLPRSSRLSEKFAEQEIIELTREIKNHVILCGYGYVGQHIACLLELENISYIGLELDPVLVQNARLAGKRVSYGDASHPGILNAANFSHAKAMVVSFSDLPAAIKILNIAKQLKPSIPILVRCKDESEINALKKQGATRVIAEVFEESLTLAHHLLQVIDIPEKRISRLIKEVRNRDYNLLRGILPGSFGELMGQDEGDFEQLRPVILQQSAYAVNRRLDELNLKQINVEVVALRRGKSEHLKPHKNIILKAGDIIVLFGNDNNLEKAEKILFNGN